MKKLLTFILVFAMILSMVTGLSSCRKDEDDGGDKVIGGGEEVTQLTPSQIFRNRAETLMNELFPCENKDNFIIKDANAFGANVKVEAPSFL